MNEATWTFVLWIATAVVLGWTWIPALIAGLGGARFRIQGSEDPTTLESTSEPGLAARHEEITQLGYEPVGSANMQIVFHGTDWRHESQLRIYWSRLQQTYVILQKQPKPMDVWWLTMFATCWNDGDLLLTSNAVDEPPDEDAYIVQGMESDNLADVEALHLKTRDRLQATGKRPEPDGRLETLLTAVRKHTSRVARHVSLRQAQTYLTAHGLIHIIMTLPPALLVGLGHWSVPLVNLTLGALLAAGHFNARRRAGAMMRERAPKANGAA